MKRGYIAIVICVFMFLSVILGAMASKILEFNTTAQTLNDTDRAADYFTKLIRENENMSEARIASVNGTIPAFVMKKNVGGQITETWIYVYEDSLCSLAAPPTSNIVPDDGEEIMPMKNADFVMLRNDLLEITFETNSGDSSINLHIPDMKGGLQ